MNHFLGIHSSVQVELISGTLILRENIFFGESSERPNGQKRGSAISTEGSAEPFGRTSPEFLVFMVQNWPKNESKKTENNPIYFVICTKIKSKYQLQLANSMGLRLNQQIY